MARVERDAADRMNEAMRAWYGAFSELSRQFALHLGMHGSDAAALIHITNAEEQDAPLTQTQLSRRIGLTTPATSSLLNRLEAAGHVERRRDQADRRVVTLRSTKAVHREVHDYFGALAVGFAGVTDDYDDEALFAFAELVRGMTRVMAAQLDRPTTEG